MRRDALARPINDDTPVNASQLAAHFGLSVPTLYRHAATSYTFEFPSIRRTTPGHFKAWLRTQAARGQTPAERERMEREMQRLRAGRTK